MEVNFFIQGPKNVIQTQMLPLLELLPELLLEQLLLLLLLLLLLYVFHHLLIQGLEAPPYNYVINTYSRSSSRSSRGRSIKICFGNSFNL